MVVFTCNNCGDSVKKPAVSKHLSFECKKKYAGVSLCCVDCLKDFNCDTYAGHTKCVTELERYSGSNFVPKASSNKGERKQNSWISTVRSVLSQSTLKNEQRKLLEAISHFENVPRKKAKFQNFIKSSVRSMRVYPNLVDSVFELIEEEFKKSATESKVEKNLQNGNEIENDLPKQEEKRTRETRDENGVSCDTKNDAKKRKIKEESYDENGADVTINGDQMSQKKKKKRKLETHDETEPAFCDSQIVIDSVNGDDEQVTRKKKKKKRKIVETDDKSGSFCDTENSDTLMNGNEPILSSKDGDENVDDEIENVNIDVASKRKKKKKKEKYNGNGGNETMLIKGEKTEIKNDGEMQNEKKETSRKVGDDAEVELESEMKIDHQKSETEPDIRVKFSWEGVVTDLLMESPNRELSMKKMKKKVAKKYIQFHRDDKSFEDVVRRFEKKLRRMSNVDVDEKRIRLRE